MWRIWESLALLRVWLIKLFKSEIFLGPHTTFALFFFFFFLNHFNQNVWKMHSMWWKYEKYKKGERRIASIRKNSRSSWTSMHKLLLLKYHEAYQCWKLFFFAWLIIVKTFHLLFFSFAVDVDIIWAHRKVF